MCTLDCQCAEGAHGQQYRHTSRLASCKGPKNRRKARTLGELSTESIAEKNRSREDRSQRELCKADQEFKRQSPALTNLKMQAGTGKTDLAETPMY